MFQNYGANRDREQLDDDSTLRSPELHAAIVSDTVCAVHRVWSKGCWLGGEGLDQSINVCNWAAAATHHLIECSRDQDANRQHGDRERGDGVLLQSLRVQVPAPLGLL